MNHQPVTRARLQRTAGEGRIGVHVQAGRTRVRTMHQRENAKIRLPARIAQGPGAACGLEAVLINTAGGLTGGDRLSWSIEAGERSALTITTQACEKVYRALGGHALVRSRLKAEAGARLAWLPQETILFEGCGLERTLEADIDASARLLACEAFVFGRSARGERIRNAAVRERWRIRCQGEEIHREALRMSGDIDALLATRAGAGGGCAVATVLLVGDDAADMLTRVRHVLRDSEGDDVAGGASALDAGPTGKLLARIVATDGYNLRKALVPVLGLLNGTAELPRIWST